MRARRGPAPGCAGAAITRALYYYMYYRADGHFNYTDVVYAHMMDVSQFWSFYLPLSIVLKEFVTVVSNLL